MDPSGDFVYECNAAGTVESFSFDPATLALNPAGSNASGANSFDVRIMPSGLFAFVSLPAANQISSHSVSNKVIGPSLGTVAAGTPPKEAMVSPDGHYYFAANNGSSNVTVFQILSTGSLSQAGILTTQANPQGMAIEPTGKYLYLVHGTSTLSTYVLEANGIPRLTGNATVPIGPRAITIASYPAY